MGGKLNVYNAGMHGVVVDKSDVHKVDGEWLQVQNGTIDPAGEAGALRVRDGMARFNGSPLAGSLQGGIGLPLPDDRALSRHFYAAYDDAGGVETHRFRTSTDGTTWTNLDTPVVRPSQIANHANGTSYGYATGLVWGTLRNKLYYPGNDYVIGTTTPTIHVFDGASDALLSRIDLNPYGSAGATFGILSIVPYNDAQMLITVEDQQANRGRVLLMDINNGTLEMLGPQTDLLFPARLPFVFQGKVWHVGINGSAGLALPAYWTRPGDPTWTLDAASATGNLTSGYCQGGCVFKGELYIGTSSDAAASSLIRKRGNAGTWSTVRTSASTTLGNHYGAFGVTSDGSKLLVLEDLHTASGTGTSTPAVQRILSYDGTTFATEYDVGSNINNSFYLGGVPVVDTNGDIYWVVNNTVMAARILKRTAAGVWSIVDGPTQLRGPISYLRF